MRTLGLKVIAEKAAIALQKACGECELLVERGDPQGWHQRRVDFLPEEVEFAINALVDDVKRLGLTRFVRPLAPQGVTSVAVAVKGGIAVRAASQYLVGRDEVVMCLDVIGKAA